MKIILFYIIILIAYSYYPFIGLILSVFSFFNIRNLKNVKLVNILAIILFYVLQHRDLNNDILIKYFLFVNVIVLVGTTIKNPIIKNHIDNKLLTFLFLYVAFNTPNFKK